MSESYFEITDQEWRSGSLAEDKLDQVQESFDSIGFAVVAGLVPPAICEQLMTAFLEDVELVDLQLLHIPILFQYMCPPIFGEL